MALSREYLLEQLAEIYLQFAQIVKENGERQEAFENQVDLTLAMLDDLEERTERLLAIHQAITAIKEAKQALKALPQVSTFKVPTLKSVASPSLKKIQLRNPQP